MAEGEGVDAIDELKFFLLILAGLGFLWYVSGGYDRYKATHSNDASSSSVTVNASTSQEEKIYIVK